MHLYQTYSLRRSHVIDQNGNNMENEQHLYHGTTIEAAHDIIRYGFNRAFAGRNGRYKPAEIALL